MKSIIIIVITLFVITDKASQGLRWKKRCCDIKNTPNPVVVDGNKTFIYIENFLNASFTKGVPRPNPTLVKKKFKCLCKLPVCVCCKFDNPEAWYVKTFLKGDTRMQPAMYSIKYWNETEDALNRKRELEKIKNLKRKEKSKSFKRKFCPMKKEPQFGNKWLYGCPPLLNLRRKEKDDSEMYPETCFNVNSECGKCKLMCREDKSGVILKCDQCGPLHKNRRKETHNNFSKLLIRHKNRSRIRAKFVQVTYN